MAFAQWGKISLFDAAADGNLDQINARLKNAGAKIDPVDQQGRTPLHEAARWGHVEAVKLLVSKGANPNHATPENQVPLHVAASFGHVDVVKYLVEEAKVPVDFADHQGDTALHCAAGAGKRDVITVLLENGADPKRKNKNHLSPADTAVDAATTELFAAGKLVSPTRY